MNDKFSLAGDIPMQYRPVPFWSWNDQLEPAELIRQIREMHAAGMGGFFMHARGGLLTEYMGKDWMDCISLCVREAQKLGMKAYLYDENGWPSGFGNGKVNGRGAAFQQKYLRYVPEKDLPADAGERIICRYDNGFAAYYDLNPYYVDNMDGEVVACFIEEVYQFYWQTLPADVRENLAGIFTDEPQLSRNGIPWSFLLEEAYRNRWNEELLPRLPELFTETGNYRRTRIRFYRLCAELFRENYIEQIGAWCRDRHWEFTGHHVLEENYLWQLTTNGAIMPQYTGYSIPGVDHLRRTSAYVTADIQVVSVAAQTGKKQILAETFGCSGWNFNFHGMAWLWQQHMVHGVNLLCQHLAGYSLRGMRKRDYPASIAYQHPMWDDIRSLHDRFSRVGYMLASGETECQTLVLHGQSTGWTLFDNGKDTSKILAYSCDLDRLSTGLTSAGIPFHYGDEILMEEMAYVQDGLLHVGKMAYSLVIIPPVENISRFILDLLQEFVRQGGKVLRVANPRSEKIFADGENLSADEKAFWASLTEKNDCAAAAEEAKTTVRRLDVQVLSGIPGQVRGTWRAFPETNEHFYFLADFDNRPEKCVSDDFSLPAYCETVMDEKDVPAAVTLPYPAKRLSVIDQETGETVKVLEHINVPGKGAAFLYNFSAGGSLFLRAENFEEVMGPLDLSREWQTAEDTLNVLTLDRAAYRLGETDPYGGAVDTISIFNRLLRLPEDTPLQLKYTFTLQKELVLEKAALRMVVEPDALAEYYLNGQLLEKEFSPEYFIDRSFRTLVLPLKWLKAGENAFEVKTCFRQRPEIREILEKAKCFEGEANKLFFDSEVEAVYLAGHFGCYNRGKTEEISPGNVKLAGPFELGPVPQRISSGGFVSAGYPFFSGKITIQRSFELTQEQAGFYTALEFSPFRANSLQLTLNGKTFPLIWRAPYKLDVSSVLRAGENQLALTFVTSRRNTLGPLHVASIDPLFVWPGSFLMEKSILGWEAAGNMPDYGVIEFGAGKIQLV